MGGVQSGDIIISFDGKPIMDMKSLPRIVAETAIGKSVKVEVMRNGEKQALEITLGELEQAEQNGLLTGRASPDDNAPQSFGSLGFTVAPIGDEARKQFNLPEDLGGVIVTEVIEGSPAAERGLDVGDVIRRIGQMQINSKADLTKGITEAQEQKKSSFLLLVRRGDRERFVAMPIE